MNISMSSRLQATLDGMQYAVMITVAAVAAALTLTFFMRTKRI